MEQLVEEVKRLGEELRRLQTARMEEDVQDNLNEEIPEQDGEVTWSELLADEAVTAGRPEAKELCSVLASPPPFDKMKSLQKLAFGTPESPKHHHLDPKTDWTPH